MMPNDLPPIPKGSDYAMRNKTADEKERWDNQDTEEYTIKLKLAPTDIDRLKKQVFMEFDALKDERANLGLEKKWADRDKQYDGQLAPIKNIEFAIDVRESKIKVDSIVRAIREAFLPDDGDIVDVAPRPETARNDGWQIAEKQQQFIDFAMDEEIKPELAFTKVALSAAKKFVGIIKQCWSYDKESRRREEHWEGKINHVGDNPDGTPILDNEGVRRFLNAYPDAPKRYPNKVKALMEGKSVDIVVHYDEVIKNNPEFKYVKLEDFYVRNSCNYNDGLRTEHLIGERVQYSYWELKEMEREEEFINVDDLWNEKEDSTEEKGGNDFMTKPYDVMEFTTYFKVKDTDEEESKIKCWFSEERQVFLGAELYPYYSVDIDYIGFWLTTNDKGFYGDAESVMYDLMDTHLAQDALISLLLHSIYVRNIITPITREGSDAEQLFLDQDFKNGKPIPVDDLTDDVNKAFSFVQYPSLDTSSGLVMLEKLKKIGSDVSRVSDLTTGGESELDPTAPASKTIALLQQSGIGVKDYIRSFLSSFNISISNLLQLYYQMSTEDRKYRIRSKSRQVTGKDVFATIKREEMVVKTNVQSRAASFAFDKVQEKKEAMAAYQVLNSNPYTMRQPKILYKSLQTLLSTFGGRWKTISEVDLLSPEDFANQQLMVAIKAVSLLFGQAKQKMDTTGVTPSLDEIIGKAPDAITDAQAVDYNPALAPDEEKK